MAVDRSTPKPCDPEIFEKGNGVCVVDGGPYAIERWVKQVAEKSTARVDWHYSGGQGNVLHLGDEASRERVIDAIKALTGELKGRVISIGGPALCPAGDEFPY